MSKPLLAALAASALAFAPAAAQRADRPLGEILEAIPDDEPAAEEPKPQPTPAPVRMSPSGIGTTALPASSPPEPLPESDAVIAEDAPGEAPEPSEAERLALWEAEERRRIEALDRAREQRAEAARIAHEEALAAHRQSLAEREEAIAQAQADYQAELDQRRLRAERERAAWEARVRACRAGDRRQCAQPGE